MTIQWGSYETAPSPGGTSGMRVGIEVTNTSVSNTSSSVTFTFKVYTQNYLAYTGDSQGLTFGGGGGSGSVSFSNSSATGAVVLRATRTYTYTYPSTSYGSSPGGISFSATSYGAFDGTTASKSIVAPVPARPYGVPAAPSGVASTRNSDSQVTTTWTRNPTTGKPYSSISLAMRTWDGTAWSAYKYFATVSSTATSYVKTGLSGGKAYQFEVRANNSVGSSAYIPGTVTYTTPAAPTAVDSSINAAGTQITTTWKDTVGESNYITFEIQRSVNGGAYANVVTGLSRSTNSWTDTAPGGGTNTYRVRSVGAFPTGTGTLYSAYATGDTISTVVPPLAPTLLAPNGTKVDLANKPTILTWKHNPGTDRAAQSSFIIEYSSNSGSTWGALNGAGTTSTASSYTIPAGTLLNGVNYLWRVRTRGVTSAGYGPNSTSATLYGASTPAVTMYPAGMSTDVRYNFVPNPIFAVDAAGWSATGTGATAVRDTTRARSGTASLKITAGTTNSGAQITLTGLEPGTTYTASAYIYNPTTGGTASAFQVNPQGSSDGTDVTAKDAWTRSVATFIPDSDTWILYLDSPTATFTSGSVWVDDVQVEVGDTETDFFSGATPDDATFDYAWVGAANNSPSTATVVTGGSSTPDQVTQLPLVISWAYSQAEGKLQAGWEANLYAADGTTLLQALSGTGTTSSVTFTYPVEDSTSYVVSVRSQSSDGIWSDWNTRTATIALPVPAPAFVEPTYQECTGTMVLHLTAADPGVGEAAVDTVTVERRVDGGEWVTIAADIPVPNDLIDMLPLTNGVNEYRVTSVSVAPSYKVGDPVTAMGTDGQGGFGTCGLWAFISYGPGFTQTLRVHSDLKIGETGARVRAAQGFLGRKKPVLMVGQNVGREVSVKGVLFYNEYVRRDDPCRYDSSPAEWTQAAREADIVCYRDYTGRRFFAMISDIDANEVRWPSHGDVSFSVTEVEYTERYGVAIGIPEAGV